MNGWLPIIGVVIGAVMQYWFSRAVEARKQIQLVQTQAYVDFLRAVTKSAHATSPEASRSAQADAADAKARVAVYGTAEVIIALARFEEKGAVLDNSETKAAFIALVGAMRQKQGEASPNDLGLVLFGGHEG